MPTYALARYEVTNEEAYAEYRRLAGPSVKLHGGSLVAKGCTQAQLEGSDHLDHMVLIEFPSPEAAEGWFRSPEYAKARNARLGGGEMQVTVIKG